MRSFLALFALLSLAACDLAAVDRQRRQARFEAAGLVSTRVEGPCCSMQSWVGGQGTPVMLIQGFGGDALVQWDRQVEPFSREHTLLVPDLVFFGGSTSSDPRRSLALQAEAMLQVADAAGVDRFDVVGVSYGGLVAWWLAVTFPERIGRLVLVDSPGTAFGPADLQALLDRHGVASPQALLLPERPEQIRDLIALVEPHPPPLPGFILRDVHAAIFQDQVAEKSALLDDLVSFMGPAAQDLPLPQQPTLLVWGSGDRVFPVEIAHRLEGMLQGRAQLVVIDGALHGPNVSHPEQFNAAVLPFLRR